LTVIVQSSVTVSYCRIELNSITDFPLNWNALLRLL